jgi:plasmid stability protein
MPTLYIRDVPEELYERLREVAHRHHRSVTKEAIVILEESLGVTQPDELFTVGRNR